MTLSGLCWCGPGYLGSAAAAAAVLQSSAGCRHLLQPHEPPEWPRHRGVPRQARRTGARSRGVKWARSVCVQGLSSDGGSGKPGREDNIGSIITMLITDQVSTYLRIYISTGNVYISNRCVHLHCKSQIRTVNWKYELCWAWRKCQYFIPISGIFLLVSKVQCTVEKCAVRMKVKITLYSTAAASGGGCSAGAAHQSRAQSTSVLRPAHLSQGCHEYSNYSNNRLWIMGIHIRFGPFSKSE